MNNYRMLKSSLLTAASASVILSVSLGAVAQEKNEDVREMETIVVSGVRASLESALARKRNASSIVDSIVAEDLGKFPDQNVAESLQRISGVSISRTNGEGAQITVRGFGPEFNLAKVNGRTLATALPGRDFDFQVISSDLIAGADVVKSPSGNTQEGSVGALINLRTARPLDSAGLHITLNARARYNDLANSTDPELSAIFNNTFIEDKLGLLLGVSSQKGTNRIDQTGGVRSSIFDATGRTDVIDIDGNSTLVGMVRHSGRQEFSLITEQRDRLGVNATLQYRPNTNLDIVVDGLYTSFDRQEDRLGFQLPNQNGNFDNLAVSDAGTLIAADVGLNSPQRLDILQIQQGSDSETLALGFNVAGDYDGFSWDADLHYSKSEADLTRNDYVPQIGSGDADDLGNYSFNYRNNDVPDVASNIAVNDPSLVRAHWNQVQEDHIVDELYEARFDTKKELNTSILGSIEGGVFYSNRNKRLDHSEIPSSVYCLNTCGSGADLSDSLFSVTDDNDFLSEEAGDFPRKFVYISDFEGYFKEISNLNGIPNFQIPVHTPRASSSAEEQTIGAFVQANLNGDLGNVPWLGNLGLRFVKTDVSSSGFSQFITDVARSDMSDPNATALVTTFSDQTAITVENDYSYILPSLNLSFDLTDNLILRTAVAKTITRPSISDLSVAETFQTSNIETFSVSSGNPMLTPYEVKQFDLGLEYYAENGNSISATFYYKGIDTFISEATILEDSGFDLLFTGDLSQARTSQQNRDGGTVKGLELAGTFYADSLPEPFDGFGLQANYTYADAEDDNALPIGLPLVKEPNTPVEGFAEHTFNVIAFYDKGPLEARLAYNWRDTFLLNRQGARSFGLPEHVDSFGQLDFSASYEITANLSAMIEGVNITNERQLRYEDIPERVSLIQYSGARFLFGLRASF